MEGFVILQFNCAYPSGELKPFLMVDDDENTLQFVSKENAEVAAKEGAWGSFACAVIDLSQLKIIT